MWHAAQIHMLAEVLKVLLCLEGSPAQAQQLDRLAERVSINRVVAGVHFPIDARAGRALGCAMARYFLLRCGLGPIDAPAGFGQGLQDDQAGSWDVPGERGTAEARADWLVPAASPLLQRLTQLALRELHRPAIAATISGSCGRRPSAASSCSRLSGSSDAPSSARGNAFHPGGMHAGRTPCRVSPTPGPNWTERSFTRCSTATLRRSSSAISHHSMARGQSSVPFSPSSPSAETTSSTEIV